MSEPVSTELLPEMGRPGKHAEGASFFRSFVQRVPDPNVWRIYGVTLALGLAYGTAISVIGRFLTTHGVGKLAIGQLAAWFAAGIVVFSLPMGPLVRRFSAKHMLADLAFWLCGCGNSVPVHPYVLGTRGVAVFRRCLLGGRVGELGVDPACPIR